jgi:hypothetical protein
MKGEGEKFRGGERKKKIVIELAQDRDRLACSCECGNEPSGSIKRGEFLD